jgi:hypothetical protein
MDNRKNRVVKMLQGLLWMLLITGGVLILLIFINQLPSLIQKDFPRQFSSIEEARFTLALDNIIVPSYFPEEISWPPSFIFAQKKPFKVVVTEYKDVRSGNTALIIVQASTAANIKQYQRIRLSVIKQEAVYNLKGKNAHLQIGTCENLLPCSQISWQDEHENYALLSTSSPFELIKIAESMIH